MTTLDVWDAKLAAAGEALVAAREALTAALEPLWRAPTAGWRPPSPIGAGPASGCHYRRSWDGDLATALVAARSDDLRRGVTTIGPHRDELVIEVGGLPSRTHASQGEQRSLALALRLAGHELVTERIGTAPILLLDDVFSELDPFRADALLACLPAGQAIVTTAGDLPPGAVSGHPGPGRGRETAAVTTWRPAVPDPVERLPRKVSESLDGVTGALGAPPSGVMASVFRHWEELVGPEIAAHVAPTSLRGGVLLLIVDQPVWAAQLRYLTADLQRRINAATDSDAVADIRIRVRRRGAVGAPAGGVGRRRDAGGVGGAGGAGGTPAGRGEAGRGEAGAGAGVGGAGGVGGARRSGPGGEAGAGAGVLAGPDAAGRWDGRLSAPAMRCVGAAWTCRVSPPVRVTTLCARLGYISRQAGQSNDPEGHPGDQFCARLGYISRQAGRSGVQPGGWVTSCVPVWGDITRQADRGPGRPDPWPGRPRPESTQRQPPHGNPRTPREYATTTMPTAHKTPCPHPHRRRPTYTAYRYLSCQAAGRKDRYRRCPPSTVMVTPLW